MAIVPEWEALAAEALEPNPLYEPWMLLPALEARPDEDFRCLLIWSRGGASAGRRTLEGLFPLQVRAKGRAGVGCVRSWRHESWLLGTPLLRRGAPGACVAAFLDWAEAGGTPLLELQYIPADGAFHGVLAEALSARGLPLITSDSFTRAFLRKEADAESHLVQALSKDARKSLRRKERRLQERGPVSHLLLRPEDDVERWIEDFLRLEASGWKGRRGSALACKEPQRRFATRVLREAFHRGRLQMVGVAVDGRPIALCCNLTAGEGSYAYRCAYDESFADCSPGILAEVDSLRALYEFPQVRWMDSITAPDNATLNRLWTHRRTMHSVVVGFGAWGELCAALLPLYRSLRRRWRAR